MKIFIIFILQFSQLCRSYSRQWANGHMYTFFNGNKDIMMVKAHSGRSIPIKKSEM